MTKAGTAITETESTAVILSSSEPGYIAERQPSGMPMRIDQLMAPKMRARV